MDGAEAIVVEDDPGTRRMISDCLRGMGLRVLEAASGTDASALLDRATPSLICLDLGLPDCCGLSVCEQIRSSSRLRDVPVIVITGMSEPIDRDRADAAGVDAYMVKPFGAAALRQCVLDLIALSEVTAS